MHRTFYSRLAAMMAIAALATWAVDDDKLDELRAERLQNHLTVANWNTAQSAAQADNPNVLLRPGLVADRERRSVTFFGEATGLAAVDPIEFFIIGEDSGHDYEAVVVALTQPRHVYEGLVFIGLPPGRGVNSREFQFWPKGERVIVTIDGMRAETLIFNRDTQTPLPSSGLVFTGSRWLEREGGERVLAADTRSPFSIAANYNEPDSLLDVPWKASQQSMYQRQTLNPDKQIESGRLVRVEMHPEYPDGKLRIVNLAMTLLPPVDEMDGKVIRAAIAGDTNDPAANGVHPLTDVLAYFRRLIADGHDPFVTLHIDPALQLADVKAIATLLAALDNEQGIRLEAPPPGMLYYRAFIPSTDMLDRERRLSHPWELTIDQQEQADGRSDLALTLTWIEQRWGDDPLRPTLTEHTLQVTRSDELPAALETVDTRLPVLLIRAPGHLTHGRLMDLLRPVQSDFPVMHVFIES